MQKLYWRSCYSMTPHSFSFLALQNSLHYRQRNKETLSMAPDLPNNRVSMYVIKPSLEYPNTIWCLRKYLPFDSRALKFYIIFMQTLPFYLLSSSKRSCISYKFSWLLKRSNFLSVTVRLLEDVRLQSQETSHSKECVNSQASFSTGNLLKHS